MNEYLQLDPHYDIYFLSDPHGQNALLQDVLKEVGFRYPLDGEIRDRLFILGDMIDRGPDSMALLKTVQDCPAMYAIQGNHEQMAFNALENNADRSLWIMNGGRWHEDVAIAEVRKMLNFAASLPLCYTLQINGHRIGLVHAAVPAPYDWQQFTQCCNEHTLSKEDQHFAVWDRDVFTQDEHSVVSHIDAVLMGHNIVSGLKPKVSGNRVYIDGAMSMGDRGLLLKYRRGGEVLGLFQVFSFLREQATDSLVWV
ncbi:metallophosphoesterase [Photobacterium sp. CAU 1568]|uniref:Metallophosphoesterase n=1 Tax=Photobacterium arenosum TaxID=2774143 RepID=A0ABR9BIS0_9GAMM|nr:metallophosphoesterase [Photobacterium arenosum]MBD8512138.1 metallophosphoesterase [Photobacterium arenosum]